MTAVARFSLVCLIGAGCVTPPDACLTGERVTVCAEELPDPSLVAQHDRVVAVYQDYLGTHEPIRVHLADTETVRALCDHSGGGSVLGCAPGTSVYQNVEMYPHELVHAVAFPLGEPPAVLQEGLAQAIGGACDVATPSTVQPDPDIARWLAEEGAFWSRDDGGNPRARYDVAASFVRYVIEAHSLEALLALYRALPKDPGVDRVDEEVRRATGRSLDEVVSAWLAQGPQPWGAVCEPLFRCAGAPLSPGLATFTPTTGEGSLRFVEDAGPHSAGAHPGVIELERDAWVSIALEGEPMALLQLELTPCEGLAPTSMPILSATDATTGLLARLRAGRYATYVRAAASDRYRVPETGQLRLVVEDDTDACPRLDVAETRAVLLSPERGADRRSFYDIALTTPDIVAADVRASGNMLEGLTPSFGRVEVCEACGSGCVTVRDEPPAAGSDLRALFELGPTPTFLRLHAAEDPTQPTEAVLVFLDPS